MPTPLDFLRANVVAYKNTLDSKTAKEKKDLVSRAIAAQFNAIIEEIKKEAPEVAPRLPKPITFNTLVAQDFQRSDASYLDLELMINQTLAVLDVVRESDQRRVAISTVTRTTATARNVNTMMTRIDCSRKTRRSRVNPSIRWRWSAVSVVTTLRKAVPA